MNTRPSGVTCSVAICRTTGLFFTSAIAEATFSLAGTRLDQPGALARANSSAAAPPSPAPASAPAAPRAPAPPPPTPPPPTCSSRSSRYSRWRRAAVTPLRIRPRQVAPRPPTPPRSCCPAPPAPASAPRRSTSGRASCTSPSRRPTAAPSPRVFTAPTVSTDGVLPGDDHRRRRSAARPSVLPKLPAAATTRIPASTARCAAWHNGSSRYDSNTGCPSDRLMIRMLNAVAVRDRPVDRLDHVRRRPRPVRPEHLQVHDPRARRHAADSRRAPLSAMMPATCVPCPYSSRPAPFAPVKSAETTTRSLSARCGADARVDHRDADAAPGETRAGHRGRPTPGPRPSPAS